PVSVPPVATLFPYTTLFRSPGGDGLAGPRLRRGPGLPDRPPRALPRGRRTPGRRGQGLLRLRDEGRTGGDARGGARGEGEAALQDRKSTRLNSSHVKISYAV